MAIGKSATVKVGFAGPNLGEQINLDEGTHNQQAQQSGGHFSGSFRQAKHLSSHPVGILDEIMLSAD